MKKTYSILFLLFLSFTLSACAGRKSEESSFEALFTEEALSLPENCHEAWIYAPSHYILEMAEGNTVRLDPLYHDFPLFCSAQDAAQHLRSDIANNMIPDGSWALYKIQGTMEELAKRKDGILLLKLKAKLETWDRYPKQAK
ncbi:MAG: hypothetical protein J5803_05640 [Desulfovibrio sp.]|nr:hypothetical protein [Desulfovibrio sp.]